MAKNWHEKRYDKAFEKEHITSFGLDESPFVTMFAADNIIRLLFFLVQEFMIVFYVRPYQKFLYPIGWGKWKEISNKTIKL